MKKLGSVLILVAVVGFSTAAALPFSETHDALSDRVLDAQNNTAHGMKDLELVKKWGDYRADLMDVHPNNMPVFKPRVDVSHMGQWVV